MNNICNVCNKGFTPITTKGSEQKYCSSTCRTIASQQRQKEKIIQEYEKEKSEQTNNANMVSGSEQLSNIHSGQRENTGRTINEERNNNIFKQTASSSDGYFFDLIERNYQTQNESNINKLKLELALKEIEELKRENFELENDLNELETNEISGIPQNEYLAGIVQQFKADPQGTITMVKELIPLIPDIIGSFFKPKAA
ncbi:MAG: hypothetical protein WCG67_06315 [Ferruginibacter sp.]